MKLVKDLKKIAILMFAIAAIMIMVEKPTPVYANDFTEPYSLKMDGEWGEKKYLEWGECHYYKFTLSKAGELHVKGMSFARWGYSITLYDEDFDCVEYFDVLNGGSESSPKVESADWVLSQGTYYLLVDDDFENDGLGYKLSVGFESYGTTTVGGDSFDSPQMLTLEKARKSAITYTNTKDWYKINVPVSGYYRHVFNTANYTLYNKNLKEIITFSSSDTEMKIEKTYLSAGTYYLKVAHKASSYGFDGYAQYSYKLETAIPLKGEMVFGPDGTMYTVTKAGKKNGTVEYLMSADRNTKTATSITVPDTVTIEGIKYNVTSISSIAFEKHTKLEKVVIGKNVTKIGKEVFCGCPNLKTITIKTAKLTTSKVGAKAFSGIHKKATIKVPKSKLKAYKTLLKKKGVSSSATIKGY